MAACDYRLCDLCGGKAFYDANLSYNDAKSADDPRAYRIAGNPQRFGWMALGYVGDWAVLCTECAKTHRTMIVQSAPQEK
jgi:hypothetical protein